MNAVEEIRPSAAELASVEEKASALRAALVSARLDVRIQHGATLTSALREVAALAQRKREFIEFEDTVIEVPS